MPSLKQKHGSYLIIDQKPPIDGNFISAPTVEQNIIAGWV